MYSMCSEYTPKTFLMDAVKNFFTVYRVDVELSPLFHSLFNDTKQGKDLLCGSISGLSGGVVLTFEAVTGIL